MHKLEKILVSILESGETPKPEDFGGWYKLLEEANTIGSGKLASEFGLLSLTRDSANTKNRDSQFDFLCLCIESCSDDMNLPILINTAEEAKLPRDPYYKRCFERYRLIFSEKSNSSNSRSIALEGALRCSTSSNCESGWKFTFRADLLAISSNDDPNYLRNATRVIGVAYTIWKDQELFDKLISFKETQETVDSIFYEIGMCYVDKGLYAQNLEESTEAFESAHFYFNQSLKLGYSIEESSLFIDCLIALLSVTSNLDLSQFEQSIESIQFQLFNILSKQQPPQEWQSKIVNQFRCWRELVIQLDALSKTLTDTEFWEIESVVKGNLLRVYSANRVILNANSNIGVDLILRPHIESKISKNHNHVFLLKSLSNSNSLGMEHSDVASLVNNVDKILFESNIEIQPDLVTENTQNLNRIVSANIELRTDSISQSEKSIIDNCLSIAKISYDYNNNESASKLFDVVLLNTITFLGNRCDTSRTNDSRVAYLFEGSDEQDLPLENDLQQDFFQWMQSCIGGSVKVEVPDVSAGRADVYFSFGSERIIVEVKRELNNSSFENLEYQYMAQASEYQNTGARLGFALVLDLTQKRQSGSIHITNLVKAVQVIRQEENVPRTIIFVKIPGRRFVPSRLK